MLRKSCLEYLTYTLKYVKTVGSLWSNNALEGGEVPFVLVECR